MDAKEVSQVPTTPRIIPIIPCESGRTATDDSDICVMSCTTGMIHDDDDVIMGGTVEGQVRTDINISRGHRWTAIEAGRESGMSSVNKILVGAYFLNPQHLVVIAHKLSLLRWL